MSIGQTVHAIHFPAISPLTKNRNNPISTAKTIYTTNDFLVIVNGNLSFFPAKNTGTYSLKNPVNPHKLKVSSTEDR